MRLFHTLPAAVLAVLAHGAAWANCYTVLNPKNDVVYRSTVSPVDLSRQISDGLRGRLQGYHVIFVPDQGDCREAGAGTGATVSSASPAYVDQSLDRLVNASRGGALSYGSESGSLATSGRRASGNRGR